MHLSSFDKRMFKIAYEVAQTSQFKNFHIGCVVAYKKHILSCGVNSTKTNPTQKKYNKKYRKFSKSNKPIKDSVHAEIDALQRISYPIEQNVNWNKVSIYIVRICPGKRLGIGMARPCPACMNALRDKGIRNIFYTTDIGFAYEEIKE